MSEEIGRGPEFEGHSSAVRAPIFVVDAVSYRRRCHHSHHRGRDLEPARVERDPEVAELAPELEPEGVERSLEGLGPVLEAEVG